MIEKSVQDESTIMMGRSILSCVPKSKLWMRRYLFLGALFLMGQLFSVAHAAEFGDHSHSHDEISCTIQAAGAAAKSIFVASSSIVPIPPMSIVATMQPQDVLATLQIIHHHRQARAPPPLVF